MLNSKATTFGASDKQRMKKLEGQLRKQTRKHQITLINERHTKAKPFEDSSYSNMAMNVHNSNIQRNKQEFLDLIQLKGRRRNNFEPLLNGAIQATDGSLQQNELIGQVPQTGRRNVYTRKFDHVQSQRRNV